MDTQKDDIQARLQIFKAADDKYIICSKDGDYLATTNRDQATALMLHPKARVRFLEEHEVKV